MERNTYWKCCHQINSVFKPIKKMHVGGLFCDLAGALDCVNHETVLATLHIYGIIRVGAKWFSSYLVNRKQSWNKIFKYNSDLYFGLGTLKRGLLQGLTVGPALFITYINDLSLQINSLSEPIIFANYTSVIMYIKNFNHLWTVPHLVCC